MITPKQFDAIRTAIETIQQNLEVTRIDGDKWSIYRIVGKIIRVDIKND